MRKTYINENRTQGFVKIKRRHDLDVRFIVNSLAQTKTYDIMAEFIVDSLAERRRDPDSEFVW